MIHTPTISLIVACAANRTIGRDGTMPWHLPQDLKHFKALTMGKPIIMGSVTYRSIGRALPGRKNIVISRNPNFDAPGCRLVDSLGAAMAEAGAVDEVMIIGGAKIYALALPLAHRIYLTQIHKDIEGDTHFPLIGDEWHEVAREDHGEEGDTPAFSFLTLERERPQIEMDA